MKFVQKIKHKIFPTKYLVREIKQQLDLISQVISNISDTAQQLNFQHQEIVDIKNQVNHAENKLNEAQNTLFEIKQEINTLDEIKHLLRQNQHLLHENQRLQHELLDFQNFYLATHQQTVARKDKKIRIAFLIANIHAWASVGSLIEAMLHDDTFEVSVFSINKRFPGQSDFSGEEAVHQFLDEKNIAHIRLGMPNSFHGLEIVYSFAPDIIFRQSQWEADYPPAFNSKYLGFAKLITIPYELVNFLQVAENAVEDGVKDFTIDSLFHRRCTRVYYSSPISFKQIECDAILQGRQYVLAGHPKIDYLKNTQPNWIFNTQKNKRIFWSAHHSILNGWSDFGVFHLIWRDMVNLFQKYPEIDFVFSPHPALMTLLESGNSNIPKADIDEFFHTIRQLDNVFEYYGADYAEIIKSCDLVLSDGISFLIEVQFLEKDILFFERDGHYPFNEIGNAVSQGFIPVKNVGEAIVYINKMLANESLGLHEKQQQGLQECFPINNCVQNIIDDLKQQFL